MFLKPAFIKVGKDDKTFPSSSVSCARAGYDSLYTQYCNPLNMAVVCGLNM